MGQVLYTVWCELDPEVGSEWAAWMDGTHIPAVVSAGGFLGAKRYRVVEGSPSRYVTVYEAKDFASLKRYLDGPAKELREDYQRRYGSRSKLTRIILEQTTE
jgi:hypothetical protein